jgi:glycerol-1-phosphate dehydrogenase [NAD(P)+]
VLFRSPLITLDIEGVIARRPSTDHLERSVRDAFPNDHLADSAWRETAAKREAPGQIQHRLQRLRSIWPELRPRPRRELPTAAEMQRQLAAAGAPISAAALGIDSLQHARDYARARLIRRRYTLLDLLADLGWLERAVAALFAPGGFWSAQAAMPPQVRAS